MPKFCDPRYALWLLCSLASCGGELKGEVDGHAFVRCAQGKPAARSYRAGAVTLTVEDRVLQVQGVTRIAAFTGPVGRAFSADDVAQLAEGELALWLGGLGDTPELARDNLARIAARHIPTVFIAGGADRRELVEQAFEALPEDVAIVHGSGLRQLRVGAQRFVIAAGAPRGRYAIDERACGLTPEDLGAIADEAGSAGRTVLLSWHAPAGSAAWTGLPSAVELGSPELATLARAVGATGGLFAFPEAQGPDAPGATAWTVPRLGPPGSQRGDGARVRSRVGHFVLGANGLEVWSAPAGPARLDPRP